MSTRILLIEDDARLAAMVAEYLRNAGYSVTHAATGAEGLAQIKCNTPDAVVLDLMLPDMDGPGVPESECERVFEPFYRRAGTSEGGVGLGLALVRQIARRHGGDALAQGNCFTVQLPL